MLLSLKLACSFSCPGIALSAEPSAIDHQDVTLDIVAGLGGQQHGRAGKVGRQAPATYGNSVENCGGAHGVGTQSRRVVSGHVAGCDGVDVDALVGPLIRQGLGELSYGALGRGIAGDQDAALERKQRGGVDDFAVTLREHLAAGVLAEEPYAVEVGVDYCLPELFRVLGGGSAADSARVVDQNVDGAELLDRVVYEHLADCLVAHVAGPADELDAGLLYFFNRRFQDLVVIVQSYIRARLCKG